MAQVLPSSFVVLVVFATVYLSNEWFMHCSPLFVCQWTVVAEAVQPCADLTAQFT